MDDLSKMMRAYFEVCDDGVLAYQDPLIGRFENEKNGLAVRLNADTRQLELSFRGKIIETFDLDQQVEQACMDASYAYWSLFSQITQKAKQPALKLVS